MLATRLRPLPLRAADELGPAERRGDVERAQLPDGAFRAGEPADVEAVDPDQLAWELRLDVPLRFRLARRLVGSGVTRHERQCRLARVLRPCRRRQRQTPLGLTTIPPQRSRASSLAIRRGPKPGWPSAKATIRSSKNGDSCCGIRGRLRSLGRKISNPCRSARRFQTEKVER
jgi:hypothetical protein